ncbi:unnamed protein product [Notodromas monacha]|uniref:Protein SPT2 homolog n=1 Tax=Notodromas monacha TaxID=399045 RepID=A0A7R9BLV3_9CRUS|nr:unnamed protein product [Notodromas monacha]CAG0916386.1 unnamed protein product [Notodromas monacha]
MDDSLDFSDLMNIAEQNNAEKQIGIKRYSTNFAPQKKKPQQNVEVNQNAVQKLLVQKKREEIRRRVEEQKKKERLMAQRSQNKKASGRISSMLKRTKSAIKGTVSIEESGAAEDQLEADDFGYSSSSADKLHLALMQKYQKSAGPSQKPARATVKDLEAVKARMKENIAEGEPQSSRTHHTSPPKSTKIISKPDTPVNTPKFKIPKKNMPPPMSFEELLSVAEEKAKAPIDYISLFDEKDDGIDRPMTAKEKEEYLRERAARLRREGKIPRNTKVGSSVPSKQPEATKAVAPSGLPKIPKKNSCAPPVVASVQRSVGVSEKPTTNTDAKTVPAPPQPKTSAPPQPKPSTQHKPSPSPPSKPSGAPQPKSSAPLPSKASAPLQQKSSAPSQQKSQSVSSAQPKKIVQEKPAPKVSQPAKSSSTADGYIPKKVSGEYVPKSVSGAYVPKPVSGAYVPKPVSGTPKSASEVSYKATKIVEKRQDGNRAVPSTSGLKMKGAVKRPLSQGRGEAFRKPVCPPMKKSAPPARRRIESDSEEEYDSEMDDFIDDGPLDDGMDVSTEIGRLFGYDRRKYANLDDDDDECMEASYSDQMKEEFRSTKAGILEDLREARLQKMQKKKHSAFIGVLATILYSSYVFLPHYTWRLLVLCGIFVPPDGATIEDVRLMP